MGILSWIIFGAIVGWLASLITGRYERVGCLTNIIVGMIGALIGGLISGAIFSSGPFVAFNFTHLTMALIVALIALGILGRRMGSTTS
ncbi:GlsB/YeaQ/YmgE family stress response membrane protein [Chloroflexi bacterium TSY]|nr:GlsB/YeaQ/YmgE family stress response membrane protein [Chloroflexi bacterium TSY]